jgi:hypothetical protein
MVVVLKRGATSKEISKVSSRLKKRPLRKTINAKKYCGTIKLKESPLDIQKKMRNEWE